MQDYEYFISEHYDMTVCSTRKIRGAVLCDTDKGEVVLKEMNASAERIEQLGELYEYLDNQSWCNVDKIIRNKENTYISTTENGDKYILKKWYAGRECDVKRPGELLEATGMLAKLHLLMRQNFKSSAKRTENITDEYKSHNRELKKVRGFIRKKSPKSEFENEFIKSFEEIFAWADIAENMLEESSYERLYDESIKNNCITHGEYNYHNILMNTHDAKSTLHAITNFEKFKCDIQMEDFYYFLRKTMEKYGWKERLGENMINAYSAVKPISCEEEEYLKIRLVYPEKFWKVANAYYNSNKAWLPVKNMEKLSVAVRQTKEKERFLKNVFAFMP